MVIKIEDGNVKHSKKKIKKEFVRNYSKATFYSLTGVATIYLYVKYVLITMFKFSGIGESINDGTVLSGILMIIFLYVVPILIGFCGLGFFIVNISDSLFDGSDDEE